MKDGSVTGRILLLVPTTSYRIGDFLAAAERLGVHVAVGSDQRQVLEQYSEGRTVTLDFKDVDRGVAQIETYSGDYPVTAIVGVDDETTVIAAKASQALGLPHNAPESVEVTRNKHRLRTRLANSGLLAPRFTLLPVGGDPARAARDSFYPAVLKPLALSASRGVIRADDPAQFAAAFRRISAILEQADIRSEAASYILVEEYVPGDEVALEGLLDDSRLTVLALFDKPDPLQGPYFEETDRPASGVMMIPIPGAGVLRRVDGIEAARALADIDDVTISIPLGETLVPVPEGNRYLGFIFAGGDTPKAVEAALRAAYAELEFTIEAG